MMRRRFPLPRHPGPGPRSLVEQLALIVPAKNLALRFMALTLPNSWPTLPPLSLSSLLSKFSCLARPIFTLAPLPSPPVCGSVSQRVTPAIELVREWESHFGDL